MTTAPQERFAPDAPFRYVGGDPSLDFVNTTDWTERGLERDRFTDFGRVLAWARGSGAVSAVEERRLRQIADLHPRRAQAAFDAALRTREVLRRVFVSIVAGKLDTDALDSVNALLADVASRARLVRGAGGRFSRRWDGSGATLESVLSPVVWSAGELMVSDDVEKLRRCAGDDCGWLFVDRSRNGLRRWCEMSVCGTTEKNRRRAR
jgi:predicted RNA-binding Zn ribbon-like protein